MKSPSWNRNFLYAPKILGLFYGILSLHNFCFLGMGKASKITSLISTHAKWQNLGHPNGEKVCLRREKKGQKSLWKNCKDFQKYPSWKIHCNFFFEIWLWRRKKVKSKPFIKIKRFNFGTMENWEPLGCQEC